MYRSGAISCTDGGPILLRPSISSRSASSSRQRNRRWIPAALVCLLSFSFASLAEPLQITLAVSEDGSAYHAFSETLMGKLQSVGHTVKIKRAEDAQGGADLYVAVGMKSASMLAARDIPSLHVFVPKSGFERLQRDSGARNAQRSAIYLDQPMERQVALLASALPGTRDIGVLYTQPSPELSALRRLLADRNIHLHERTVDSAHPLNDALESVLDRSEVLFVLPDTDIYNAGTIRNILLTSYRKQIPLIGLSPAYVKAGALCAVYSTPEQLAAQAFSMIERYAATRKLPAAQYPSDFEVSVNVQVARSLDLRLKEADRMRDEIRRAP